MASDTNSHALSKAEYEMVCHIIDIKELEDLKTFERNIYRVPCTLRNLNNEAYTPQLISIGPLHFNKRKLNPMQKQKLQYFHLFWVRVKDEEAMNNFKKFLERKEDDIRHCYAVKFSHISKQQFMDMLLLDAVFIMELFLRISLKEEDKQDCILKQTWLNKTIQRDLLLLENQIPFFILDELYNTVVPETDKKQVTTFIDLAYEYFKCFDPHGRFARPDETQKPVLDHKISSKHCNGSIRGSQKTFSIRMEQKEPRHFSDLIRYFYLCKNLSMSDSSCIIKRSATKLQEAGVSFQKVEKKKLLYIKFKKLPFLSCFHCLGCIPKFTWFKARLQIPQFKVDHTTECVLRNLIAFEQCHYADKPYVCNYVSLIDSLIHTKDDVELLVEREVIVHELGSDTEVATIVNGLCKNVVTNSTCYKEIIDELNKHYESMWNRTMAALRLVYFRDTWRTSSTLVGIAVLIYTMLNFYRILRDHFF